MSDDPNQDVPEQAMALQMIIEKACTEPDFRKRVLDAPADVLAEFGILLPEGHTVKFVECTEDTTYISLPALMDM